MIAKEWLTLMSLICGAVGNITVIPPEFTVKYTGEGYPYGNLTILCQPPSVPDMLGISFMQIHSKRRDTEDIVSLVSLSLDLNQGTPVKQSGLTGRTAGIRGAVVQDKPAESYLRLEFVDRSCLDEGTFYCKINFFRDGARPYEVWSDSAEVTTTTEPDGMLLHQSPAYDSFLVNQTVELRCSGQVGSPPAWLRWSWRYVGAEDSDFQQITFGVLRTEGPYPQGFCKYFRASTLYLRATTDLDGVEIRCLPVRGVTEFTDKSASFTFKVKEAGCIPDCWNGGVCVQTTCHCTQNFTGAFCEQPVAPPPCYTLQCKEASRGASLRSVFSLYMLLLILPLVL